MHLLRWALETHKMGKTLCGLLLDGQQDIHSSSYWGHIPLSFLFVCLLVFLLYLMFNQPAKPVHSNFITYSQSTSPATNLVQATFVSHLDPYNNLLKIHPAVTLKCILYIANGSPCISWTIFNLLLWFYTQKSPNGFLSNQRCYNVLHSPTPSNWHLSDLMI